MIAIVTNSNPKFNLLLLPLLLGFPSPLLADSTSGYKKMDSCLVDGDYNIKYILAKKENSNSKKWGTYVCKNNVNCWTYSSGKWLSKGVSYDEANDQYEKLCGN